MGVGFALNQDGASWDYWDEAGGAAPAAVVPEPWDIVIEDGTASFLNCVYRRGPVTLAVSVAGVPVASGESFLAAKINTETGAAEVISGESLAAVTDSDIPGDPAFIKVPLYKLETTDDGATSVVVDYRKTMNLTLYV